MNGLNLSGKVAVVTGAGSGIGKAIAKCFAAADAKVYALDINVHESKSTVDEIKSAEGDALDFACDVTDASSVDKVFADIAQLGPIDVLVNSAGRAHIGTIATTNPDDFEKVLDVNVKGTYLCMKAAIAVMVGQRSGTILNMASIAGSAGIPDRFAYSTSKGAVHSMTLSVARDFLDKGIRCNCISPARVHTPFVDGFLKQNYPGREQEMLGVLSQAQPIGRMATPDEVACMALYLCSDQAGFLTGVDIPFDGGFLNLRS